MAFLRCEITSESLRMATAVDVILPDKGDLSEVKTLYLLHGLTDDCTGWTRYTAVERYARERGLAVVLPEVQRSFYTDMAYGLPYFTYVSEELPAVCRRMFGLSAARERNYIFGLSMGGYGAMKCALTYPDRYAGAASFSGVADLRRTVERRSLSLQESEITAIFGEEKTVPPKDDLFALAERLCGDTPGLYLSCGEQDGLYAANCRLDEHLRSLGIVHQFEHWPGAHSWDFWDRSLRVALAYFFD